MKKYEYFFFNVGYSTHYSDDLARLGREGWIITSHKVGRGTLFYREIP